MMALSGVVVIHDQRRRADPLAIALCLLLGLTVGAANAFISVYQRTEPFIITLGMGIVLTGIGQQLTNAHPVSSADPDFQNIANLKVLGPVPILVFVMIAVVAVTYWVLRSTSFGRNVRSRRRLEVAKYRGSTSGEPRRRRTSSVV
jgi:ribose/xylose/arabinose/galactoside ABC-type transport system permease subunit